MTNPVRLFSMQVPKIADIEAEFTGSIPEIDQAFSSALCAGMPEKWYKAARLKWCMDDSVAGWLKIELWQEMCGVATREKWRIPKGKQLVRRLSELAVIETAQPERFTESGAWKIKCEYIGIGKSQWYNLWESRYEVGYRVINDWSNRAYSYLVRRQQEDLTNPE